MLKQSINLVPARPAMYQAKLVFYMFLGSLTMFFVASLITYCIVRTQAFNDVQLAYDFETDSLKPIERSYQPLHLPTVFWSSTTLLIAISFFLQRACWLVHREYQDRFRRCLVWAWVAAVAFVVIQSFGMVQLLNDHFGRSIGDYDGSTKVYGMTFTLAFIHALHVLGGILFLAFVIRQSFRNRYDHERHWAVDHCTSYWHFLDVVWVTMLIVFVSAS